MGLSVAPPSRRGSDNFDLAPARLRPRHTTPVEVAPPVPPEPMPRSILPRERLALSGGLAIAFLVVGTLVFGGAAVVDFTGPNTALSAALPGAAPFTSAGGETAAARESSGV